MNGIINLYIIEVKRKKRWPAPAAFLPKVGSVRAKARSGGKQDVVVSTGQVHIEAIYLKRWMKL